jgi:hypothetical protein
LCDVRTNARHHREQDSAAPARPEQTGSRVADKDVVHRQWPPAWPASLVCRGRWAPAWLIGRYGQVETGLDDTRKLVDVDALGGELSIDRLGCGCDLAWLIRREHPDQLTDASIEGVRGVHGAT